MSVPFIVLVSRLTNTNHSGSVSVTATSSTMVVVVDLSEWILMFEKSCPCKKTMLLLDLLFFFFIVPLVSSFFVVVVGKSEYMCNQNSLLDCSYNKPIL